MNLFAFNAAFFLWLVQAALWGTLHPWPTNLSAGAIAVSMAALCLALRAWEVANRWG
jgi:hypothetical protein